MQTTPQLPPVPPVPPTPELEPKKKGFMARHRILTGVVGGFIVLMVISAIAPKTDTPKASAGTAPAVAAPACVDIDQAMRLTTDAQSELQAARTSAMSYDFASAALHTDGTAADYDALGTLFSAYPTISGPAHEAADEMRSSGDALRGSDVNSATSYMQVANTDIIRVNTATRAAQGTITPC